MTIYCLAFVMMFSVSCMGWGFGIKGVDNSKKKTQIAGAIVEEATGVKTGKIKMKADVKADVKAMGADLSKKTSISGGQHIEGVDMQTLMYIIGGFFTLMTGLIAKMFLQLAKKDRIILDLGNDAKEILLKILPQVNDTIHRAYENGLKALEKRRD